MTDVVCYPTCDYADAIPMPPYPPFWTGGGGVPVDPTAPYVFCPTIPATALAGSPNAAVRITGQNFAAGMTVKMGADTITPTSITPTEISFLAPHSLQTTAGVETIQVLDGGAPIAQTCQFTYTLAPKLTVTCPLVPASAVCGSPDILVDVKGTNFTANTDVRIDGVAVATTFVSPTLIRFTAPSSTTLTPKTITVGAEDGADIANATCPFQFTQMVLVPTLTSMFPDMVGRNDPVATLTLKGTNFGPDSTILRGGLAIPTTHVDATTLTAQTNPATISTGTFEMRVRNGPAGAYEVSTPLQGMCVGNPVLNSLTPNTAVAGGAAVPVELLGINFGDTSVVLVDGVAVPTTRINSGVLHFNMVRTAAAVHQVSVLIGHQHGAQHDDITPSAAPLTLPFTVTA